MVPWPLGHMFVEKSINFEDFILQMIYSQVFHWIFHFLSEQYLFENKYFFKISTFLKII
jgi:hypothetical protein